MGTLKQTWYTDQHIADCYFKNGGIGEKRDNGAIAKTARELDIKEATIYNALCRLVIKKKKLTPKEELIIQMCQDGKSNLDISKQLNCTPGYISRILTNNGFRKKPAKSSEDVGINGKYDGRHLHKGKNKGYIWVRISDNDPMASMRDKSGRIAEHRLIMAQKVGRLLRDDEEVHHIDGNRQNNHPDNLQLRQGGHGAGITYCCADCGSKNIKPCEI